MVTLTSSAPNNQAPTICPLSESEKTFRRLLVLPAEAYNILKYILWWSPEIHHNGNEFGPISTYPRIVKINITNKIK